MAGRVLQQACVVLMAVAIASAQVQAAVVGSTCASYGPDYVQKCVNEFVTMLQQKSSASGMVGTTCSTVSPDYRQDCINTWIKDHLAPQSMVKGCGGVSPTERQACLNNLVIHVQQNLADKGLDPLDKNNWDFNWNFNWNSPGPIAGSSCSTVTPSSLQGCINSFVLKLQAAENGNGVGAVCAESDQACIDGYVLATQVRGGVLGGCAGVAPDRQQDCINNYVLGLQQKGMGSVGAQAPQAVSVSATTTSTSVTTSAVQVNDSG